MDNTQYNAKLTFNLYLLAALFFGFYGSTVCPMLDTLPASQIFAHVVITFGLLFLFRHFLLSHHSLLAEQKIAQLDTTIYFFASIPLALFYNLHYHFPLDSNLKVVFGMTLFGFFTGTLLQLSSKLKNFKTSANPSHITRSLQGERQSMVNQLIALVMMLIITLTVILVMVSIKDLAWLEMNPDRIADGSGSISIIKEFIYISAVLSGYAISIMYLWRKLMKNVLQEHEHALVQVTQGDIQQRLPVYSHDELGSMAVLTNEMIASLQSTQDELQTTRDVAIVSLSALAESRDNETGAHILRTQEYVKALAEHLSQFDRYRSLLTPQYIELLHKSAPLHDIGKVGVPDNVLLKPGKLTKEEFETMKQHPQIGADALATAERQLGSSSFLRVAKEISLTHHEKWDGSGYPNQLSGESIPLSGRLMALADVYDALITKRVYKPAFSHEKARSIILEGSGSHFDPQVVNAFLAIETSFIDIAARHQDEVPQEEIA
ncbi:HD domain-containing protein [Vibrio sp. S4M6]|uniref:HD-GYP domain-containing protein n=1 Tax=Vibrio sinus TaxID=2946865 RepID=UPI00202AAA5A|nr:HD domain-containing phosphohydrolase [Vibrio sinus]MCL9781149.1 HD domain-containing protein [Vibrio sinus]